MSGGEQCSTAVSSSSGRSSPTWIGRQDSELVPDPNAEQTVYLIPSYGDDEEAWEILERVHPMIFENELYGWHTDEAAWPQGRDFGMFKAWFEIELHSVVEDLCDYEIVDEDAEA